MLRFGMSGGDGWGERQLKNSGKEAAEAEIEIIKNEINRKLYQKPPLLNA